MKTMILKPPDLLPDADRVLWRSGTPPSRAGAHLMKCARDAISRLAGTMAPVVAVHNCKSLPAELEPHFDTHLGGALNATVMLATLGGGIDEELGGLMNGRETLKAHMFNSAASESVELLAAWAQMRIAAAHPGMDPTKRLAPGYCGIPLEVQSIVVGLFPGLGVTCNESFYLVPSKTMTGVWGWVLRKSF